jgi:hypothetical protein
MKCIVFNKKGRRSKWLNKEYFTPYKGGCFQKVQLTKVGLLDVVFCTDESPFKRTLNGLI